MTRAIPPAGINLFLPVSQKSLEVATGRIKVYDVSADEICFRFETLFP